MRRRGLTGWMSVVAMVLAAGAVEAQAPYPGLQVGPTWIQNGQARVELKGMSFSYSRWDKTARAWKSCLDSGILGADVADTDVVARIRQNYGVYYMFQDVAPGHVATALTNGSATLTFRMERDDLRSDFRLTLLKDTPYLLVEQTAQSRPDLVGTAFVRLPKDMEFAAACNSPDPSAITPYSLRNAKRAWNFSMTQFLVAHSAESPGFYGVFPALADTPVQNVTVVGVRQFGIPLPYFYIAGDGTAAATPDAVKLWAAGHLKALAPLRPPKTALATVVSEAPRYAPMVPAPTAAEVVASNPSVAFIQRAMARMAESTPAKPATVRFEFYGQSITVQTWTQIVQGELSKRFPSVKFSFVNPSIGGYHAGLLLRTAEHDLYPWYPDILVFHVYGSVDKYEEIVRNARARTTAEIVLWTSHLGSGDTLDKNPDTDARIVRIREIAKRYDCTLIDVRRKWIAYITEKNIPPQALLKDVVHLNGDGIRLMAAFIAPQFVRAPELATTPQAGTVTDVPLDSPAVTKGADGSLTLAFQGNRVVAISAGGGAGAAEVLLDGEPMAGRRELWAVTRPSNAPMVWWPAINQVRCEKPALTEDWTLTCLHDSTPDGKKIHFRLVGSKTGPDGEGFSDAEFVSTSGRAVFSPVDFSIAEGVGYSKTTLPEGFQVTWQTYPLFTEKYEPQPAGTETVLVQNCANAAHKLTLKGSAEKLGIAAFRVYAPAPDLAPPLGAVTSGNP